jgi:hypothetical protein
MFGSAICSPTDGADTQKRPLGTGADLWKQVYAALIFRPIFLAAALVFAC